MKETEDKSDNSNDVVVTDIKMSFGSMVVFMVKWVIASIPAFIILCIIGIALVLLLGIVVEILFASGEGASIIDNVMNFIHLFF